MNIAVKSRSVKASLKLVLRRNGALFITAHFMHHIPGFLILPLSPFIRDSFNLSYSQISWLISAYTFANGIANIPAGWLGDRLGPRILITISVAGVAACGVIVGISPSYLIIVMAFLFMGILVGDTILQLRH